MRPLARRAGAAELLDAPQHDPATLRQSLAHVAAVNRWLGGERALLRHLPALLPPQGRGDILDVGTGSAEVPRLLAEHARRDRRAVRITATDIHPQVLELARAACEPFPEIAVEHADVLSLPYADHSFDVALLTLTLHHMEGADQVQALRELMRVSRCGIIVGELERARLNYLGARLLGVTLWRRNPVTRHDGPLSVLRAFTAAELEELAARAGLRRARVHRHFFYRLALVASR